ncbi:hypothetical protein BDA99DRAFT_500033 [Phascolomyces articulosus]|uniref:Uncharacterized protein n=1 Tax=Phascolomyces articulosus TaxID=60185 RepID=A0AAD5KK88_9FUNG|nr:hypothetical protein BDA99DRAFT_500033 [Phascolomyces articulosus]
MSTASSKRHNDDDDLFALSYRSMQSDLATPPDKRLRMDEAPTTHFQRPESIAFSQAQHSIQSLNSPPPSPLNSKITHRQQPNHSTNSIKDPEEWKPSEQPPNHITSENYDEAIPTYLPQPIRLNQLMIWSAREAMMRNKNSYMETSRHSNERKAERIALDIQSRIIQGLLNGKINTSFYYARSNTSMGTTRKNPNPKNEVNRQRIKDYKQALPSLHSEENEWKEVTSKLFDEHAAMLDNAPSSTATTSADDNHTPPTPITQDLLDGLDDNQKLFLEKYCQQQMNSKNEAESSSTTLPRMKLSDMEIQITELRQRLSTIQQFQKCVDKYCKDTMAKIARNLERGSLGVSADQASLEMALDSESLKELGNETTKDVLRMLSQYKNV